MKYYNNIDEKLCKLLNVGISFDVIRREVGKEIKVILYFLSSLADSERVNELNVSLMLGNNRQYLQEQISSGAIELQKDIYKAFLAISSGMSVLLHENEIYVVETRNYPSRSVSEPDTEKTIRGSKDGFNENIIINIGLIRRRIRSEHFKCEIFKVGENSNTDIVVSYLDNKVNHSSLNKIIKTIKETKIDGLVMSDRALEEKIFKQKFNPFPLVRYSERPDVVAAHLLKGHIAIIVDTSSSVIITPTTLFEHTKHIEEYRQVPAVGTFIRLLRYFAILISIFLVPLWMLTLNNDSFTSNIFVKLSNESPIPVLAQIIIVELVIELLRIATIHTPNHLSSAMGLIATLILGQMAVDIGLFQSEILLYCSISSIGGFATPSYELSLANKLVKLLLILVVGLFGSIGFIISFTLLIIFLASIKTHGLPYLYPLLPFDYKELVKVIFRPSVN